MSSQTYFYENCVADIYNVGGGGYGKNHETGRFQYVKIYILQ